MKTSQDHMSAFTLLELLVVVAVLGLILAALSSGLARSGPSVQAVLCLSSKRQLFQAWQMYADQNVGKLPPNSTGGNAGKAQAEASWAGGWLDYSANRDNTNTDFLVNHARYQWSAYLGPYVKTPIIFKCPSDQSGVNIAGTFMPRVRTVSMNNFLGDWSRTWTTPSKYSLDTNYSAIARPALRFVFLDERADSINDGNFMCDPDTLYQLIDYPGNYHGDGCTFVFADGHGEIHRWLDRRTMPVLRVGQILPLNENIPGNQDVLWLSQHAAGVQSYP
jgi:prepilin-type N-terminal cleavage/methylation domain-containing protein/prepilin-type processing-associated H-X9-DG protein